MAPVLDDLERRTLASVVRRQKYLNNPRFKFTTITPIASRLVLADGYEERDGRGDYQVGVYSKGFTKPRQPSC